MGGSPLTIPCTLVKNGIGVDLDILADTGANGFAFIDTTLAGQLCKGLGFKLTPLARKIQAKGYDGQSGQAASHYLTANLIVEGRRQYNIPFIVLDLGVHEVILGRKWFEYFRVNPDVAGRRLIWPPETTPTPSFMRILRVAREDLVSRTTNSVIREDIVRRDTAIARNEKRRQDGKRSILKRQDQPRLPLLARVNKDRTLEAEISLVDAQQDNQTTPPLQEEAEIAELVEQDEKTLWFPRLTGKKTWLSDTRSALQTMTKVLTDRFVPTCGVTPFPRPGRGNQVRDTIKEPITVDIQLISAAGFRLNCQDPENTLFTLTLEEIDREIGDRQATDRAAEATNEELLARKLPSKYQDLIDVFSKTESDELPPHRAIDHKIVLEQENELRLSPLYHMSLAELQTVKQYLLDNLSKGFIAPSQAPYASPVLFVKKPDGSLRFCIDYRKLNAITRKDRYPLPLIDETLARISRAKIYTKLDIRQAFHRIRIDPASEDLTTFRTRYGSYKCKVLPFGLTNGPATFQYYMNETLMEYLDDFCTAYLDDILIYSDNPIEHEEHVRKVLLRLRKAGLQADIKKCEFNVTRTKYLGFIISTDGVEVDPEKVEAIRNWKQPTTVKGVQSFLGFCNFYRRFIRDYGRTAAPLTQLTRKDHVFHFDENCVRAFKKLQDALTHAPLLTHFNVDRHCLLETDASDTVIAAVFSQLGLDGEWHPVSYFSKTLAPAEMNYPIHDKEMLAIVRAFEHWRAELEGTDHPVEVLTDHQALEYFMSTKLLSARQARWAEVLSRYNFKIIYRPGSTNKADPLTRMDADTEALNRTVNATRQQQLLPDDCLDPRIAQELKQYRQAVEISPIDSHLDIVDSILRLNRTSVEFDTARILADLKKDH